MALYSAENLVKAIEKRDILEVDKCLHEGANPNLLLPIGVTPFHLAGGPCMDIVIIQALLDNNANPNVTDSDGVTLSHIAAMWDKLECLQLLYNSGADIFKKDKLGFDVLWYAKDNKSMNCIKYVENLQQHHEFICNTPKTPTFDCNVSFRRKKTPKSCKSTPQRLKSVTSPSANENQYTKTVTHCSACKKSFSPQLCSDCHKENPTKTNHVKDLSNQLNNIDINNSTLRTKSVVTNCDMNLLLNEKTDKLQSDNHEKSLSCNVENEEKHPLSVNASYVYYQTVLKQNEMLSESSSSTPEKYQIKSPNDVKDSPAVIKTELNATTYDPEMQEFLQGCLPVAHASYDSAGGLDVSSPDNCMTYTKSSSSSDSDNISSNSQQIMNDETSVWVTCCKPSTGDLSVDSLRSAADKSLKSEHNSVEFSTLFESADPITATPKSTLSSSEYRQKLLFSTKPKQYFDKLKEQKVNTVAPIKIINQNVSSSDNSSDFTLADSTVPLDETVPNISDNTVDTNKPMDKTHCLMVDQSLQICNISTINKDSSNETEEAVIDKSVQLNTSSTSTNNELSEVSENSYEIVINNSIQLCTTDESFTTRPSFMKTDQDKQFEWSKISENDVCDVLTDDDGIALLEHGEFTIDSPIKKRLSKSIELSSSSLQLPSNTIRLSISEIEKDESTLIYNSWKDLLNEDLSSNPSTKSPSDEERLEQLSDEEIRQMLLRFGCHPGPISASRSGYIKRLKSLLGDSKVPTVATNFSPPIIKANVPVIGRYSAELEKVLNGHRLPDCVADDDVLLRKQFENGDPNVKWREGKLKNNFNYILLDPRKLNGLSDRISDLSELQSFQEFLSAIFYIGKGKQARPYAHFCEALQKNATNQINLNSKVKYIHEVWSCDLGVISLHMFQSVIACEAFTREASMLDAIKLSNLTNRKRGDYYGKASTWSMDKKEQYGTFLLMKALKIYAVEGERQIKPANLKLKQQWPKNANV